MSLTSIVYPEINVKFENVYFIAKLTNQAGMNWNQASRKLPCVFYNLLQCWGQLGVSQKTFVLNTSPIMIMATLAYGGLSSLLCLVKKQADRTPNLKLQQVWEIWVSNLASAALVLDRLNHIYIMDVHSLLQVHLIICIIQLPQRCF